MRRAVTPKLLHTQHAAKNILQAVHALCRLDDTKDSIKGTYKDAKNSVKDSYRDTKDSIKDRYNETNRELNENIEHVKRSWRESMTPQNYVSIPAASLHMHFIATAQHRLLLQSDSSA